MNEEIVNDNHHPLVLIILDGWGYSEKKDHNAIVNAKTPNWDSLWQSCPHSLLVGSGPGVGLPEGQMGNSEVGHLNIGAGRIIDQDYTRIENAIKNGTFDQNPVFLQAIEQVKQHDSALHIMGLLSDGGVHSHEDQIHALVRLAAKHNIKKIYFHAFLDGRDTAPQCAQDSIDRLEAVFDEVGCGRIASLVGRYYAMDRDKRWPRIEMAYDLLTQGDADFVTSSASACIRLAYEMGASDEFVKPTLILDEQGQFAKVQNDDVLVYMNYRADRARALSYAFTETEFNGFERKSWPKLADFVTLTQYAVDIKAHVAFPPTAVKNILGEIISQHGMKQLRIAETEKYAHITFFFNGGIEEPFEHEHRVLIPSPKVATYDLQPEMSAYEVTDSLCAEIASQQYAFIVCNFANPDMVGHTGNFEATVKAVEVIDQCLGKIMKSLREVGGEAILTADHGNAEHMFNDKTQQRHTAHTYEPVPFVYVGREVEHIDSSGILADIAPTILNLLGLEVPSEMTGKSLIRLKHV